LQVRESAVGADLNGERDDAFAVGRLGGRRSDCTARVVKFRLESILLALEQVNRDGASVVRLE